MHLVCLTAASAKLDAVHADKLWGQFQCGWVLSLAQRAPAPNPPPFTPTPPPSHAPSLPPSLTPSHLLQLSNHPMTFKGAWHPFEVGEGALALVSCPNPTQANKMHAGLKPTKANSCPLNVKQTRFAFVA